MVVGLAARANPRRWQHNTILRHNTRSQPPLELRPSCTPEPSSSLLRTHSHTRARTHTCHRVRVHAHAHTHAHTHTHIHTHTHTHVRTRTCTHARTRTCTHARTGACTTATTHERLHSCCCAPFTSHCSWCALLVVRHPPSLSRLNQLCPPLPALCAVQLPVLLLALPAAVAGQAAAAARLCGHHHQPALPRLVEVGAQQVPAPGRLQQRGQPAGGGRGAAGPPSPRTAAAR
jgi:hypothetical protein